MALNFARKHLSDIKSYIILSILIFFASVYLGFSFASDSPDQAGQIIEQFRGMASVGDAGSFQFFIFIFSRNALVSFMAVSFGVILAILPVFSTFTNGAILGIVAYFFSQSISLIVIFLAGILPHGVFELPAFFVSAASGMWLGVAALRRLALGERKFRIKFLQAMKFYFLVIVPVLFLAALVEAFITPGILEFLTGRYLSNHGKYVLLSN